MPNATREAGADSVPIQNPRVALIADLSKRMAEAASAGDLDAARIAHEAIAKLLASPPEGNGADVVSITKPRGKP